MVQITLQSRLSSQIALFLQQARFPKVLLVGDNQASTQIQQSLHCKFPCSRGIDAGLQSWRDTGLERPGVHASTTRHPRGERARTKQTF